jgi:hypothetical protein
MIYWEHTYMENGSIKTSESLLNADKLRALKSKDGIKINIINSNFYSFAKKYKGTEYSITHN